MASLGNIWGALEIIRAEDSELEQTSLALSQPDQRVGREALHTERKRVSGNHFRVFRDGETGAITITDTSTWGTFVDAKKLIFREPVPLPHGAVITLAIAEADSAMFALRFHKRGGGPLQPFVFKPKLKTQSSSQWNPNETMSDGFATPGSTLDRQNGNSNRWAAASKKVAVGLDVQRRVAVGLDLRRKESWGRLPRGPPPMPPPDSTTPAAAAAKTAAPPTESPKDTTETPTVGPPMPPARKAPVVKALASLSSPSTASASAAASSAASACFAAAAAVTASVSAASAAAASATATALTSSLSTAAAVSPATPAAAAPAAAAATAATAAAAAAGGGES